MQWNFVIKSVGFQPLNFSKVATMIYNSISDACICIQPGHTITRIWPKNMCYFTKTCHIFHNGCMTLATTLISGFMQDLCAVIQVEGKFKMMVFQCRIMNLLFIYFAKIKGEGCHLKGIWYMYLLQKPIHPVWCVTIKCNPVCTALY